MPGASWQATVDRGVRVSLALAVLLGFVVFAFLAPKFYPHPGVEAVAGLGLLVSACALTLASLATSAQRGWPPMVVTALIIVGLLMAVPEMATIPNLSDTWWPRPLLLALVAFLVMSRRLGWLLAATVTALNAALRLATWIPNPTLPGLTAAAATAVETGQLVASSTIASIATNVAGRAAREADTAIGENPAKVRESWVSARAEADRFIHDEVLHTMRAVSLDRDVLPAHQARTTVDKLRRLLAMDRTVSPGHGFLDRLRADLADCEITVLCTGPAGLNLPHDVDMALRGATRECVRNAARHSGAQVVEVSSRRNGPFVSVVVSDDGRGFDPGSARDGLGLRHSVTARLADIGGSARVVSASGRGTRVYLRWTPVPVKRFDPQMLGAGTVPGLLRSAAWMIVPSAAQGCLAGLLLSPFTRNSALSIILTVALAGGCLWGARRGASRGLTLRHSVAPSSLALLATYSAVQLAPPGAHPRMLWLAVLATSVPSILSLFRPLPESVVLGVSLSLLVTVCVVVTAPRGVPLSPFVAVFLTPCWASRSGSPSGPFSIAARSTSGPPTSDDETTRRRCKRPSASMWRRGWRAVGRGSSACSTRSRPSPPD